MSVQKGQTRNWHGQLQPMHGMSNTRIFFIWQDMIKRCFSATNKSYRLYGARGITVCKRWRKFENFYADMGDKPAGKSLDRIDNNGNYEPRNCRWATPLQQGENKRNSVRCLIDGKEYPTINNAARNLGVKPWTVRAWIKDGKAAVK